MKLMNNPSPLVSNFSVLRTFSFHRASCLILFLAFPFAFAACTKKEPLKSVSDLPATTDITTGGEALISAMENGGCFKDTCQDGEFELILKKGTRYEVRKDKKPLGSINLNMKDMTSVEKVFLGSTKNHLIVTYQMNNGEEGASKTAAFTKKGLAQVWSLNLRGFNLSKPVIEDETMYVSTIGFVAKIDLKAGKFNWKHEDLYETRKLNAVDSITRNGDVIEFKGENHTHAGTEPVIVNVDDRTGKIIQ